MRQFILTSIWNQTVHFVYITSFLAEGKQTHLLRNPKTLPTKELRQKATKYYNWKIMFTVWTVCASLSANGCQMNWFILTTVSAWNQVVLQNHPIMVAILNQMNVIHILRHHFFKVHFKNILIYSYVFTSFLTKLRILK